MTKTTLLVDGDWLCFKCSTAVETVVQWEEDVWTLTSNASEAFSMAANILERSADRAKNQFATRLCETRILFSDPSGHYFRHDILPTYKGNRKGKRKPVCYKALRSKLEEEYSPGIYPAFATASSWEPNLEADDLMGIYATCGFYASPVIVTIDKDLDTVPGWHYNPDKDSIYQVDRDTAIRNRFKQALIGDATDGYKGCPGAGKVKADKILGDSRLPLEMLDLMNEAFESAGLTARDAMTQLRVAHILQHEDYDFETGEVEGWA